MDRLEAMQMFQRVADLGSFSRAAVAMAVSQSTVSKQVALMEGRLGVQLLRRTTRGLSLTEAGQQYYDSITQVLASIDEAEARVGNARTNPGGLLRVAISAAFGRFFVVPVLPEFFARYPEVTIDLDITERHVSLVEDGIDLAIRIGALSDSSLVAKQIGSVRHATVGTPAYFAKHGVPVHPRDVAAMPAVVFQFNGASRPWRFAENGEPLNVEAKALVRTNDAEHIRAAVLAGLGMGHNPSWLYASDLREGRLRQVLVDFRPPSFPVNAVSHAGRRQPRKAQVFVEFLAEKFGEIAELNG
ncbi:MAG: LysR substrate-binding domain-containing protein [Luteibacter sp.]